MSKSRDNITRRGPTSGFEPPDDERDDQNRVDLLPDVPNEQFEPENPSVSDEPPLKDSRRENLFAITETNLDDYGYGRPEGPDSVDRFHDRMRRGKVKICSECGSVMTKSSRMILSPVPSLLLVVLGTLHMIAYGFATKIYEVPWFLKFVLPSIYYIGSIFIAFGVMFFFFRERVWQCQNCREVNKR